jgi:hypothetical protein
MENKTKKNLERSILAAGGVLSAVAINEIILSKKEHDRKEREINKVELEKDIYMKKIGAYEPFDVEDGAATPNDSKLVNLLTRAVGVAFTNNDVFTRNKSNIRTFPFIISNNSSLTAAIEVELRKYYEVMVASQVANLINHTVFAAENILNVKDDGKRTVDKIMDKVFSRSEDLSDLGTSLQRGIYENVLLGIEGNVVSLNEEYTNAYPTIDQYINDFSRMIKVYVKNVGEKNRRQDEIERIKESRKNLFEAKKNLKSLDLSLAAGQKLDPAEDKLDSDIKDLFKGKLSRSFDGLEDEKTREEFREKVLFSFKNFVGKYTNGKIIADALRDYLDELKEYHNLLEKGLVIITNNNFSDPDQSLMDADPYYRLLDLNLVTDYDNSSPMTMKLFKNSTSAKVKLEMAAALLISTEILPFEFIEYATKYLGLQMHDKTRRSITMKYGDGTKRLPFSFMGNKYIISGDSTDLKDIEGYKANLLKFYEVLRPNELADRDSLVKKLTRKQLIAGVDLNFFDLLRSRGQLETI